MNKTLVILGSVFAVITGCLSLIDYFKSDYSLQLLRLSSQVILSPENTPSSWLDISFNDQRVNSLHSTRYRLINTGRKSIENSAVLEPISIEFENGNRLINLIIDSKHPKNLSVNTKISDENKIQIEFELLNSSEHVDFDIYSLQPLVFRSVEARIKNIINIEYSDKEVFQKKIEKLNLYDKIFLPLSFLALISLIFRIKIRGTIRSRALSVGNYLKEPNNFNPDFLKRYVEKEFYPSILTFAELCFLNNAIDSADKTSSKSIDNLSHVIYETLSEREIPTLSFYLINFVFYLLWFILNSYIVFSKLT